MAGAYAQTRSHESELLGRTEAQATALAGTLDIELRIIRHDRTPLTVDVRPNRMTLDLRTGTVTTAEAG